MAGPIVKPSDAAERPELHLSGEKLRIALTQVLRSAEPLGGIEKLVEAVKLRSEFLAERFGVTGIQTLERSGFDEAVTLMATVRRRIGGVVAAHGWPTVRAALADLVQDAHVPGSGDEKIRRFHARLARPEREGRDSRNERSDNRSIRDLAAEVLHAVYPEHYPLMTRWIWDARTNTGALREIWHDPVKGDEINDVVIPVADTHETFLVLREELSQFLSDNGVFRDMIWYVDIVLAHIYGTYINAQGGAYIKADFSTDEDPLEQTRRLLGLDRPGGKRWAPVAGEAFEMEEIRRLS